MKSQFHDIQKTNLRYWCVMCLYLTKGFLGRGEREGRSQQQNHEATYGVVGKTDSWSKRLTFVGAYLCGGKGKEWRRKRKKRNERWMIGRRKREREMWMRMEEGKYLAFSPERWKTGFSRSNQGLLTILLSLHAESDCPEHKKSSMQNSYILVPKVSVIDVI